MNQDKTLEICVGKLNFGFCKTAEEICFFLTVCKY